MAPDVLAELTGITHARKGERLLTSLREKEEDAAKVVLLKLIVAHTKRAHAWVICQGPFPREAMKPGIWREEMVRNLGLHGAVYSLGGQCHPLGRREDVTNIRTLSSRSTGRASILHTHVLDRVVARNFRQCCIPRRVYSRTATTSRENQS